MFVPGKPFQSSLMFVVMAGAYPSEAPARVFVPGKPFQPSLMFVVKAGAYPSEALLLECLSMASLHSLV